MPDGATSAQYDAYMGYDQPDEDEDDEYGPPPCIVCGNEERTAAGYLTCECPAPTIPDNGDSVSISDLVQTTDEDAPF